MHNNLRMFHLDGIPPAPRGVPQIEVTFDVDANGILNVSAVEKATGKSNKITITNEKGRLSQSDIDKMVQEAEKFKAEDELQKKRIDAKNGLENYCYTMRNTMQDENIKSKIDEADRNTVDTKLNEIIQWLDHNQDANTVDFENKQKEIEAVCNPVMMKAYGGAGGMPDMSGMPGGPGGPGGPGAAPGGPTVEEVD
ncbi:heat shock protein 70 [Gregarina niphandrodes]|uniref:Heat shock protein 70 n=2 Tax=Gregarina niphandrodes TaxID=110365 RepID=A0A023AVB5_GRENI|nr:heat shock protein 70 [Gregarina niphandrodes]EZG42686.1 heat shock protein 70 [Gregarina niphandrodes]|eukprot:XP_011134780.1 heat shock protein 70 [Gregarina niphandrodes]